jgi:isopentenyl phosphate kinase
LFFCIIIDARLIPNIAVNQDGSFSTEISTTEDSKFDVTGGINLKLNTAKNIVIDSNGRILVYICNVTSKPADVFIHGMTLERY